MSRTKDRHGHTIKPSLFYKKAAAILRGIEVNAGWPAMCEATYINLSMHDYPKMLSDKWRIFGLIWERVQLKAWFEEFLDYWHRDMDLLIQVGRRFKSGDYIAVELMLPDELIPVLYDFMVQRGVIKP